MNLFKGKSRLLSIALAMTLLTVLLSISVLVNATDEVTMIYGPEAISTGGDEETPQIALDSNGNVHIVWSSGETYLFYKMLDSDGNVLIDETNLNPCATPNSKHVRRPSIVIDSDDNIHVVFHGFSLYTQFGKTEYGGSITLDASEVIYIKFNPYLDDRDGDAANFYDITVIPETIISTDDGVKSRAPNIAIDAWQRLHVVWFDGDIWECEGEIHYLVMDTNGNELVSESVLADGFYTDVDWSEPEIVVDSSGNAHIFFVTEGWTGDTYNWRDIWYVMADDSDGSILIAPTQLTDSGEQWKHSRPQVAIDSNDVIHVVYHDSRYQATGGQAELFLFYVEPYLDDRDGDPADPSIIVTLPPTQLTSNDGYRSYLKNIAIDPGDREHIVWIDQRDFAPSPNWGIGEVYYMLRDVVSETRLTYFDGEVYPAYWWYSSGRNPDIAVTCSRLYITFNGYNITEDTSDIYLMIVNVPPCAITPVGGEVLAVNRLQLITPYLLVLALAVAAIGVIFGKRFS
ncbi:hypothetical protein DRO57_03690 [Candidatus Bathyarchaeota archaeon]|mgnify:CR=1 FL=1|nr:MAG: hypothetical protein DRO57_03690 [Candidatus Bathyarchaeota archaeon]